MTEEQKLDLPAVREHLAKSQGPRYWRGLEELAESPGFRDLLDREFPRQASEWNDEDPGFSRRRFVELMGASLSLAGLAACTRQPAEKIVPYVKQPEEILPGRPLFFATAATHGGYATGLLVESNMGRPTKIEGNPDHPASLGATDAFTQATLLTLYDPDRSQVTTRLGEIRSFAQFVTELQGAMKAQSTSQGAGLRILTETVSSPTLASQLRAILAAYPKAKWHQWEPAGRDAARAGARLALGEIVETRYDVTKADVLVTLDSDFLTYGPGCVRYARDFASRRRVSEEKGAGEAPLSRLYAIESSPTNTGTLADHRLALTGSDVERFALALALELGAAEGTKPALDGKAAKVLASLVADLRGAPAKSLVVPGDSTSPELHALCHALNRKLGNIGQTVVYTEPVAASPVDQTASLRELADEMSAGKVDVLLVLSANPIFTAPSDIPFRDAMDKVPFRARLGLYADETSENCHWHVPESHELEAWSDARAFDGTVSFVQPLIAPLYGGSKSAHEFLAALTEQPDESGYDLVRKEWQRMHPGADFEAFWRKSLHDGFVPGTALPEKGTTLRAEGVAKAAAEIAKRPKGDLELMLRPDPTVHDGRFANNGWLQELPKPHTKITWDNAVLMSYGTAQKLGGLVEGDVVEVAVDKRKVAGPVWRLPGHADGAVTIHFGYGRRRAGRVGNGAGFDAYPLRTSAAPWGAAAVTVSKTGRKSLLASTQEHFPIEVSKAAADRHIVRAGTISQFRADPEFAKKMGEAPDISLYPPFVYDKNKWGLSVDLSTCTGCNACVVACQSENNVPVVGKDQVSRGREMHWIRIDRYFEGDPSDPTGIHHQPVMCQHCENAPCEVVCPVAATTHSDEGLNNMTYNRCVGTKYCSNNCPYKVRRFNFFQYSDVETPVKKLLANPNVTVRNRGVMEKCTYCVQRINAARIVAEREGRAIRDGEIRTACQQVCPTGAIVFGNMNDTTAAVTKLKKEPHAYGLVEELNTRPRTTYLAKITNPSPALSESRPPASSHEKHAALSVAPVPPPAGSFEKGRA